MSVLPVLNHTAAGHRFPAALEQAGLELRRDRLQVLQVNLGRRCNQACRHCHVDAGPARTEMMDRPTVDAVLDAICRCSIRTLDITGGAPELNPHFEYLVREARALGCHVLDRCNLTVLFVPEKAGLAEFLAEQEVEIIASLPCYDAENVDHQRGPGVFEQSIAALRLLNALGYGDPTTGRKLNLVYNPVGPHLPPPQAELEAVYREELDRRFGVRFTRLYTLANMPINRYAASLRRARHYEEYLELLVRAFNPATISGLMCRDTVSVSWDGHLYDCDFNQMLELPAPLSVRHIRDLQAEMLPGSGIATGEHCFGCTAGAGSSCGGALVGG